MARVFAETSWRNRTLSAVSQAGLVNNLNDGMSWGAFPLLFVAHGVSRQGVGLIKAVYPIVWGVGQIVTGHLADRVGRKPLIVWGMIVPGAARPLDNIDTMSDDLPIACRLSPDALSTRRQGFAHIGGVSQSVVRVSRLSH